MRALPPISFSIVTPSYRQLRWLKLCVASVGDQEEAKFEHIIQDAETGPELVEWVRSHSRAKLFVERDSGMYDAINRGFRKATGDIMAWLNCDEQYLPGALGKVAAFFEQHPEVDVLFGDAVLLSESGELLSYRRAILPSVAHIKLSHLNTLSCATFVRRSVIDRGLFLKPEWKAIADAVWVTDMLKAKLRMAVLPEPLAAFSMTEENLGQTSLAYKESERWQKQTTSAGLRAFRGTIIFLHRIRKFLHGAYTSRDMSTRVYTHVSPDRRVTVSAENLTFAWTRSAEDRKGSLLRKLASMLAANLLPKPQSPQRQAGNLPFSTAPSARWPLAYSILLPLVFAAGIVALDQKTPDVVMAPVISLILMLLLSFRLNATHLLPFAATFTGVIFYSLRYLQPFDPHSESDWMRLSMRIFSFLVASALAILFSKYRRQARERLDQTFSILTMMPVPVIISDATGVVIFANDDAAKFLKLPAPQIQGDRYVNLFMANKDEGTAMRDYIKFFQNSLTGEENSLANALELCLTIANGEKQAVRAKLICIGEGQSRFLVTVLNL